MCQSLSRDLTSLGKRVTLKENTPGLFGTPGKAVSQRWLEKETETVEEKYLNSIVEIKSSQTRKGYLQASHVERRTKDLGRLEEMYW